MNEYFFDNLYIGKLKEKFIENYVFCKNATYI